MIEIHKANTRGFADHGWLKASHSFSFANYHNQNRMHFGVVRVLNDDAIAGGMGFGTHPHDNMEIITIPLEGALAHKDSMGNASTITAGEVQVMSAGTGVQHSEFNASATETCKLFQIWLFPKERNVEPRYQQMGFLAADRVNKWQQLLSPNADDEGVWIHQDAWFFRGDFSKGREVSYEVKLPTNGVYLMLISGKIRIDGQELGTRDAVAIKYSSELSFQVIEDAQVLLLDIPMALPRI